jgi:hypothetical protein
VWGDGCKSDILTHQSISVESVMYLLNYMINYASKKYEKENAQPKCSVIFSQVKNGLF